MFASRPDASVTPASRSVASTRAFAASRNTSRRAPPPRPARRRKTGTRGGGGDPGDPGGDASPVPGIPVPEVGGGGGVIAASLRFRISSMTPAKAPAAGSYWRSADAARRSPRVPAGALSPATAAARRFRRSAFARASPARSSEGGGGCAGCAARSSAEGGGGRRVASSAAAASASGGVGRVGGRGRLRVDVLVLAAAHEAPAGGRGGDAAGRAGAASRASAGVAASAARAKMPSIRPVVPSAGRARDEPPEARRSVLRREVSAEGATLEAAALGANAAARTARTARWARWRGETRGGILAWRWGA